MFEVCENGVEAAEVVGEDADDVDEGEEQAREDDVVRSGERQHRSIADGLLSVALPSPSLDSNRTFGRAVREEDGAFEVGTGDVEMQIGQSIGRLDLR